ncbi:MAG: hypothetical protein NTZ65_00640 [Candidatus Berkelbacteria bacterium]|nr:hypothetical protein [Candidatus Berkelbacteria bacterium]
MHESEIYQKVGEDKDLDRWRVIATTLNSEVSVEVYRHGGIDEMYTALHVKGVPEADHLILLRRPDGFYQLWRTDVVAGFQWWLMEVESEFHRWRFFAKLGRAEYSELGFILGPDDWGFLQAIREGWNYSQYVKKMQEEFIVPLGLAVSPVESVEDANRVRDVVKKLTADLEQGRKAVEGMEMVLGVLIRLLDRDLPASPLGVLSRSQIVETRGFTQLTVDQLRSLLQLAAEVLGKETMLGLTNLVRTSAETKEAKSK